MQHCHLPSRGLLSLPSLLRAFLGTGCANLEHSNWEAPEAQLLSPMHAILIAYARKVPSTQGPGLWTLSEPDMRLRVVRIPCAVSWHSKKKLEQGRLRAVFGRTNSYLPTNTCRASMGGCYCGAFKSLTQHCLSQKYRFCHFDPFSGSSVTLYKQGLGPEAS